MSIDKSFILTEKEREDIRLAALAEAAALAHTRAEFYERQRWRLEAYAVRAFAKEMLDLGEPKPDPRTRKITVQLKEWTYTCDRDHDHPVQRFRTGLGSGVHTINEHAELLLYALEQEREKLVVRKRGSKVFLDTPMWTLNPRLEHLNLFLGEE